MSYTCIICGIPVADERADLSTSVGLVGVYCHNCFPRSIKSGNFNIPRQFSAEINKKFFDGVYITPNKLITPPFEDYPAAMYYTGSDLQEDIINTYMGESLIVLKVTPIVLEVLKQGLYARYQELYGKTVWERLSCKNQ